MSAMTPGRGESIVVDSQQPRPGTSPLDECRHEMMRASCIWCTPRAGVEDLVDLDDAPRPGRASTGWSQATRYGECGGCGEQILPGDTIRWSNRARLCEGCGESE